MNEMRWENIISLLIADCGSYERSVHQPSSHEPKAFELPETRVDEHTSGPVLG